MSYKLLKVTVGLFLAISCRAACASSPPGLIVVREPIVSIPWGYVSSLAFSPDGKYLAVMGAPTQWFTRDVMAHPAARKGGSVACWTVADWKLVATPQMDAFYRDGDGIRGQLIWTPDSTKLVIYDGQGVPEGQGGVYTKSRVSHWNRNGWRLISTTEDNPDGRYLAMSPDGGCYVSHKIDDGIDVWDLRTGSLRYSISVNMDPTEKLRQPDAFVRAAAYSSDGKWLAVSYGDVVCLINVATRAVISWRRMPDRVHFVQFQPNIHFLLALYGDRSYQLLAAPDLAPVLLPANGNLGSVADVQFSTNGKWFAVTSYFGKSNVYNDMKSYITLVETASMKVFGTIGPVKGQSDKLTISLDGSKVGVATFEMNGYTGSDSRLLVFPTSKPGGPSPDEWLKMHPGTPKAFTTHRTLPLKTPPGILPAVPKPVPAPAPAPMPVP